MSPSDCLLTDNTGYPGNIIGDPAFVSPFVNNLRTAIVLDEGGNSISVRYTTNRNTNYHIQAGSAALTEALSAFLTTAGRFWLRIMTVRPDRDYLGI